VGGEMHILPRSFFFLRKSCRGPRPCGAAEGHRETPLAQGRAPVAETPAASLPRASPPPRDREDDLHICLTACWRAVRPPNYCGNTEPLALEVSGETWGGAASKAPGERWRGGREWGGRRGLCGTELLARADSSS
jgi:hypothetical protein